MNSGSSLRSWRMLFTAVLLASLAAPLAAQDTQPATSSQPTTSTQPAATEPSAEGAGEQGWPPGLLMQALEPSGVRKTLDDFLLRFYGYEEAGFTGRLTGGQNPLPLRGFDARRPDNLRQNQLSLTGERTYDTSKPIDFGGKIEGLFGGDAMLTHSRGLLDNAGEGEGDCWADLFQAYATMWLATGNGSGLETLVGKFASPMGYEGTEAVNSPMYSHSYMFAVTPYTHTGVKLTENFNPNASVYFAVVNGWDDFQDNNHAVSYMLGGSWQSADKLGDSSVHSLGFCAMTGPEQDGNVSNYRTALDGYYTRRWTEKLSQTVELGFGDEDGAVPGGGRDNWYGIAHYLTYAFNDVVTGTWRAEFFRNERGTMIGFAGNVMENTLGLSLTPWPQDKVLKNLSFRPEFRWDYSDRPAFGDDHRNMLTAAVDAVFKF